MMRRLFFCLLLILVLAGFNLGRVAAQDGDPVPTPAEELADILLDIRGLLQAILESDWQCVEWATFDNEDYHNGWNCHFVSDPGPTPTPTPTAVPPTGSPSPAPTATQEVTALPTPTPSSTPMATMATPVPTPSPTPTGTPNPDRLAVLRLVSAPDKNVRARCDLKGGIIGTWPVAEARVVFSFSEADGFIWANQAYGDTVQCTAIGYRTNDGVVWWVRHVSGDLLTLPGWPGDLDTDAELPPVDRTYDTSKEWVGVHMLPGADYDAIFRNASKFDGGSVTFDLNWWAGARLAALNPNAENICRTTRWGDVPDINNLDGWYWQQVNTMPSEESGLCQVYQIGNEYSQWFTTEQWVNMNIRFIELAEQEGLGRRLGLGATGPGHLPVEEKDRAQFERLLNRMIQSPISHVLIIHQSGYCDDPACANLPYVNDPWVAGSDDKAFNGLLGGRYDRLVDVRIAELGLGDGYTGGAGGPSDCDVIARAIALTRDILSAPHRQPRVMIVWNWGAEDSEWVSLNRCTDQIAAAL
jgi:hypothetical protein